jgi:hypothetical protein
MTRTRSREDSLISNGYVTFKRPVSAWNLSSIMGEINERYFAGRLGVRFKPAVDTLRSGEASWVVSIGGQDLTVWLRDEGRRLEWANPTDFGESWWGLQTLVSRTAEMVEPGSRLVNADDGDEPPLPFHQAFPRLQDWLAGLQSLTGRRAGPSRDNAPQGVTQH